MFTSQVKQIDNAARLTGQQSAKELVQAIANCSAPLSHRGTIGLDSPPPFHDSAPSGPSGVRRHSVEMMAPPSQGLADAYGPSEVGAGYRQPPLWRSLPWSGDAWKKTLQERDVLDVRGRSRFGDVAARRLTAGDAVFRSSRVARDSSADGWGDFGCGLTVAGPTYLGGDATFNGAVTSTGPTTFTGPVYHYNQVTNFGPTHNDGPTYNRVTFIDGTPIRPTGVPVVADIYWDGSKLRKVMRILKCLGPAGGSATSISIDCDA